MAEPYVKPSGMQTLRRGAVLAALTLLTAFLARTGGFSPSQVLSSSVFIMIILATLLFWPFRLAIAFVGIAALLGCRVLTLPSFIESCELDIILFLVGMMVTVGVLKDLGLFTWIIQTVLRMKNMTGPRFVCAVALLAAALACIVDEVTSIVFVTALVFQVCDTLKIRPTPFVITAVLATNVGSAGTMLGNPVGILIGYKAGFTFGDFVVWSLPVTLAALGATLGVTLYFYRHAIAEMSERLRTRRDRDLGLGPLVKVPYRRGLFVLGAMMTLIALHHALEVRLNLERNTVLIVVPLLIAGVLMIWRHQRARHYIEQEVEWWTLLFFMMLFAVAGTLEHTGVTKKIAEEFALAAGSRIALLVPMTIAASAIGSAFVDNVVFVAAAIPVVREMNLTVLWWALLFGACYGGNITMIGSTANIVAIGMLEKRYRAHMIFSEWLKIGLLVGLATFLIAWAALTIAGPHMPAVHGAAGGR